MIRKNAIKLISKNIGNSPIISANGYISRDLFEVDDKKSNFYMIGSMGLSSSIALGISLNYRKKKIYVLYGKFKDILSQKIFYMWISYEWNQLS